MPSKKIEVKADNSPELVAIFNPWEKAKQMAGTAEARIESSLKTPASNQKSGGRWRWGRVLFLLAFFVLLVGAGFKLYSHFTRPANPIAPELSKSLPFSPYAVPKDNSRYYTYNYRVTNAEGQAKILSFNIITPDDITITVSEYPQPEQLNNEDIPQFLSNVIQQYAKVESKSGTVYLGRATGAGDKQVAVLIENKVLTLMTPSKDMTSSQWQRLGDQLVKIDN